MPVAIEAARAEAAKALEELRTTTPPTPPSLDKIIAEIPSDVGGSGGTMLLSKDIPSSGRFAANFAFVAQVGNGYLAEYVQVAVRLCVSYSGDLAHLSSVGVRDLACPPGLPDPGNSVPVSREIKLHD